MRARADYWREAVMDTFEQVGLWDRVKDLPSDKLDEIGESMAIWDENQSLAFHMPENPLIDENDQLKRKLSWQRDLVGCDECKGRGRINIVAGPWVANTGCHVCHGAGKVHPRGEREPA